MDILLTGRVFSAEEAKQLGLVQRVFPKEALMQEVMKYADDMAIHCPVGSMAVIKQQVLAHQLTDHETALRESNRLLMANQGSPDVKEGMISFVKKRSPTFGPLDVDRPEQRLRHELFQQKLQNAALTAALNAGAKAAKSKL